ncbi:2'-5' RNA ligase family protein [Amycolatopsis saalfeldensis]|uniref:2'-5' RNA ligase superfamily protein n=1 Tax=Amycolatopsis saalfeldensis TaxID=394193 RepID=A0A1H8Y3A4_9PSEU|nr:2'-5' RNA ligase family protein [Amycolatopsis saalfeldensis]SEP46552.1 hypothetical protein SAMN04489732_110283 [Amycolatopsis saalfeldensis]
MGDWLWPPGHRELQLILVPDLEHDRGLAQLVTACRKLLAGYPATDRPLPDECLHMTLQPIHHGRHADAIDAATRRTLITELGKVFAATPAFTMLIGSVLAHGRSAVADADDVEQFDALLDEARRVIAEVCGPDAVAYDTRPAHMAIAYASATQASDSVQGRLRREVRPSYAPMTVKSVALVEVEQDPAQCAFRWRLLHQFYLADPSSSMDGSCQRQGSPTVCTAW